MMSHLQEVLYVSSQIKTPWMSMTTLNFKNTTLNLIGGFKTGKAGVEWTLEVLKGD